MPAECPYEHHLKIYGCSPGWFDSRSIFSGRNSHHFAHPTGPPRAPPRAPPASALGSSPAAAPPPAAAPAAPRRSAATRRRGTGAWRSAASGHLGGCPAEFTAIWGICNGIYWSWAELNRILVGITVPAMEILRCMETCNLVYPSKRAYGN